MESASPVSWQRYDVVAAQRFSKPIDLEGHEESATMALRELEHPASNYNPGYWAALVLYRVCIV